MPTRLHSPAQGVARTPLAARVATHVRSRFAPAVVGAITLLALPACSGSKGQQAGAQSPERQSDAEYDLARDLFQKGQARAALDHAMKSIGLNEENDKAHYFVAVIYSSFCSTNRGFTAPDCKLGEIEKYARGALKANPDFRDAKNMLGQVLVHQKRCKEAIAVLEPLTKDPAYVHPFYAWGNLGEAQICDGSTDAAIGSLKNAVAAEPRFCVGHYRLGIAYEKKGDVGQAESSLTSAITADPQCETLQDAWEARCRVRFRVGHSEDARKDCERCREISTETAAGKRCVQMLAGSPSGASAAVGSGHIVP